MSNQKGFIKIIIITAIAFIIATAGYFVLTQKNVEAPATIQESDTAGKTAQLTDGDSATKDWGTYRNEEYGFQVKYPLNVSVKNWAEKTPNMSLLVNFGNNLNISDNVVSIYVEKGTSMADIETETKREDLFNNLRIEPQSIKDEKIGKDNYPAKKIDYKNESSSLDFVKYLIDNSGLLYQVNYRRKANSIITESNFNLMLSTFEFIENKTSKSSQSYEGDLSLDSWEIYSNEKYGFELEYPTNIFHLDKNTNTLSHTLKNFHKYSMKDGSDLGLANDISIVFKKENDKGCNWLEEELDLKSIGVPFEFKNIKGVKYETGAEGEGVVYYCVKNKDNQNIFLIERWFLNVSYSTELPKQNDYIDGGKQEEVFNQILSTFKFNKQ